MLISILFCVVQKEVVMAEMKDDVQRKVLLGAIGTIKFRTEKQTSESSSIDCFVPVIDFSELASANTHILFGRNGTGKTHILKAFFQHCQLHYEHDKILPVYVDFRDLDLGTALSNIPLSDLIRRFYQNFLHKIIGSLEQFSDEIITVSLMERLFKGSSAIRKAKIQKSIELLKLLLSQEQIEEALEKYNRSVTVSRNEGSSIEGKTTLAGQASLSPPKLGVDASIGASANRAENEKETIELIYRGLAIIKYEAIREELENLIQACGANAIIILVDEWNSIDLSVQPVLAEMIRKTIGRSNKIFLKIATLRYYTRTSMPLSEEARQRIGWQPGIDITQLVDLDHLLGYDAYKQGVKDFLTFVAYQHTCLELPVLKDYTVKEFEDYLCNELFESHAVYSEVVRSSEGNPRDFLIILSSCCNIAKLSEQKIALDQVMRSVLEYFNGNKQPYIGDIPGGQDLYKKIFDEAVRNNSKLFLFSRQKAESNKKLQELWHFRAIHLINQNLTVVDENNMPHEYMVYSMDYGKLLSLKVDARGEEIVNKMLEKVEMLPEVLGGASSFGRFTLSRLANSPKAGGQLVSIKRTLIRNIGMAEVVKAGGVEPSDISDINHLIKHCVLDRLLD